MIGGGPAGLTAAIYLSRFHLSVSVIDAGGSRAAKVPMTRNHAGFPDGISGEALLARMREQARRYGAELRQAAVTSLRRDVEGFTAIAGDNSISARTVLIATGVVNRRPSMIDNATHERALAAGQLRYCPICDGYEVTDRRVAVLGTGERGSKEALFLRSYTRDVTLIAPEDGHALNVDQQAALDEAHIQIMSAPHDVIFPESGPLEVVHGELRSTFDALYPALGSDIRSELAAKLGAKRTEEGC